MPPKSKKSSVLWKSCENCKASITSKDYDVHASNCPPDLQRWRHHFVQEGTLYSELNVKQSDDYNGLNPRWMDDYVFLSQSIMQLCGFVIGDYVVIHLKDKNIRQVKYAWPCFEKSLTSVLVSQRVFDSLDLSSEQTYVTVSQMRSCPIPLEKIHISFLKEPESDRLDSIKNFIKGRYVNKILQPVRRQSVHFFGKIYKFDILKTERYSVAEDLSDAISQLDITDTNDPIWYKILPSTKWFYVKEENKNETETNPLSNIGGLDDVISELRDILAFALGLREGLAGLKLRAMRGVLLYGHTGCGKTLLARSIIQDSGARLVQITGPEIFSKFFGATETALRSAFIEAKQNAPSVILLDEIDILCPARPGTDQERRVTSTLLRCLDELQQDEMLLESPVAIIATTTQPDNLDPAVRRAGRLETEIELSIPDAAARLDILQKLFSRVPNQCSTETISRISKSAHGCTGADLAGLYSTAVSQAVKRVTASTIPEASGAEGLMKSADCQIAKSICILDSDLEFAAMSTKPSAMREVAVEVPDVKWSDIGGQHDLKLKLKQAVEWPLTHPESFLRLGITPPRGVLMYGPPGCSKTMIAKALASESGLNFLSVKGPELFSQFVGESERAVRALFRRARRVAPAIVFFDEIDALGASRGSGSGPQSGSNVQERVLAQLLTELDGVAPLGNVTVVAATNRPDRLDKALLRPGRLDRIVYVPLPDWSTRHEIFSLSLSRMPAAADVRVETLADLTGGYSGAEVRAVCHEAAMIALEQNMDAEEMTWSHFESALKRVQPRTPKELLKLYEDYANES